MTSRGASLEAGIDPREWHVDLSRDCVTHFPTDTGYDVSFFPRDFESDGLLQDDFVAELVHYPAYGAIPSYEELERLCRIAALLYARRYLQALAAREFTATHPDTHEDAA